MKHVFNSFNDLENFMLEWVNFSGEGMYDLTGALILLRACLRNIKENCDLSVLNELDSFFSEKELLFLKEFVLTLENTPKLDDPDGADMLP
ncbi:hypothetical protein AB9T88_05585 [Flavobacterium sp. LBUM151]|jgi:hypothetical protein